MSTQMLPLCVTFEIVHKEKTVEFFTKILSMSILEGCETACDGPHEGKWSKTMIGYDNDNFKLALICGSKKTLERPPFDYLKIASSAAIENIKSEKYPHTESAHYSYEICDPNGYKFIIIHNSRKDPKNSITEIYNSSHIEVSFRINLFWVNILKLKIGKQVIDPNLIIPENKLALRCKLPVCLGDEQAYNQVLKSHVFHCRLSEITYSDEMINLDRECVLKLDEVSAFVFTNEEGHEIEFFRSNDLVKFNDDLVRKTLTNLSSKKLVEKKQKKCCLS